MPEEAETLAAAWFTDKKAKEKILALLRTRLIDVGYDSNLGKRSTRANFALLESGRIPNALSMSESIGIDSFFGSERCRSPIPSTCVGE